jgi:transposase
MEYGAIDLHMRRSQIRIEDAAGHLLVERRIDTQAAEFTRVFAARPPMRILLETSTESEWVAECLEALGHEVIVADTTYAAMYGGRTRRIKTDRRDVAALVTACRLGIYRPVHRVDAATRLRRQQLRAREQLVRVRTSTINTLRALLRQHGIHVRSGHPETLPQRLAALTIPPGLAVAIASLQTVLAHLSTEIHAADRWVSATATADTATRRLMTIPGIGPVTAVTYTATLDTPARFAGDAARASAYLGLVPREYSSGERRQRGRITKAGPPTMRALLVEAAWRIWIRPGIAGAALHAWVTRLAARRGRRVAIVALARRLSRILFAICRDGTTFTVVAPVGA